MRTSGREPPVAVTVYITDHVPPAGEAVTGSPAVAGSGDGAPVSTGRMPRGPARIAGIVVVLLALACLIAVNQVHGSGLAGRPMAFWPEPPPVGSCLDLAGGHPRTVPCAGPHDAEVTRAFGALNPMVTDTSRDPMYDACDAAAANYLGAAARSQPIPGNTDWEFLPLAYRTGPVDAPADQRAGRYGWMACVLEPAAPVRYVGSVHRIPVTAAPAAYRWCLDQRNAAVSCALPHATEVLATLDRDRSTTPDAPVAPSRDVQRGPAGALDAANDGWGRLLAECTELASSVARTADPTYGGVLNVGISPLGGAMQGLDGGDVVGAGTGGTDRHEPGTGPVLMEPVLPTCISQVRDGRLLTGSVFGRGDVPPPLTGR
jgi:hypothetical protein